jgi:UDPglucose 6-dehydrogenase
VSGSKIAVAGAGYVGLSTAAHLAHLGHSVTVVDVDAERIGGLVGGIVPIYEPGLEELLRTGLDSGRLLFTLDYREALTDAEFLFVCVATPDDGFGNTDLSMLESALTTAAPFMDSDSVVVVKSTVPVGTTKAMSAGLNRSDVQIAFIPEFLQAGKAVEQTLAPDRLVVSGQDDRTVERVVALFEDVDAPVIRTDLSSAELIKQASNAYLAVRLTFVNQVSALANASGGCAQDILAGMGADPRIGTEFLEPGPGWGGSCLPKDSRSLVASGRRHGVELSVLQAALDGNVRQFERVVDLVLSGGTATNSVSRVGVLGLTFKAGTDDLRDSPAIEIIQRLLQAGVNVSAFDPMIDRSPLQGMDIAPDAVTAVADADALLVLTGWPEFGDLDPARVAEAMAGRLLVDTRRVLDKATFEAAGFEVRTIG